MFRILFLIRYVRNGELRDNYVFTERIIKYVASLLIVYVRYLSGDTSMGLAPPSPGEDIIDIVGLKKTRFGD